MAVAPLALAHGKLLWNHGGTSDALFDRGWPHLVSIGQPASAQIRAGAGVAPPELLRLFEEAFSTGLGLGFHYTDREGRDSNRRIEPHGLLVQTPVWYVLARDLDKQEPRMFRMDRIARPRILKDVAFQPDMRVIQAQLPDLQMWQPLSGSWA